ncbi:MAG: RNA polymerase sigma factor [Candidatus Aminicenantaceae bacterium]
MDKISEVKQLSDEELASNVIAGSRTSFEELAYRYRPRLFHFLRHRASTDQDIEDLIQETFIKAFRNIDRYNSQWKFSTWLYTTAVRLAISHYRSNKGKRTSFMPKSPSSDPQEIVIQKEESQNIWALARTLSKEQYEALCLRYMEDLSLKEIAKVMKKNQIQIRVLLHRARLNLAKKFKQSARSGKFERTAPAEHKFSLL